MQILYTCPQICKESPLVTSTHFSPKAGRIFFLHSFQCFASFIQQVKFNFGLVFDYHTFWNLIFEVYRMLRFITFIQPLHFFSSLYYSSKVTIWPQIIGLHRSFHKIRICGVNLRCSRLGWVYALVSLAQIITTFHSQKRPTWITNSLLSLVSGPWCTAWGPVVQHLHPLGSSPQCSSTNDRSCLSNQLFYLQGTLSLHRPNCFQMLPSSLQALQTLCWLWRIYSSTISNLFNSQRLHTFSFVSVKQMFWIHISHSYSLLSQVSRQGIPVKILSLWKW